MSHLTIVGCVQTKARTPKPIRDLYSSPLWAKRVRYAKAQGRPWLILSAKYGILEPDDPTKVEPYDVTINDLTDDDALKVCRNAAIWMARYLPLAGTPIPGDGLEWAIVEVLAGRPYADVVRTAVLMSDAMRGRVAVVEPLNGLQIGERLRWFNEQLGAQKEGQGVLL